MSAGANSFHVLPSQCQVRARVVRFVFIKTRRVRAPARQPRSWRSASRKRVGHLIAKPLVAPSPKRQSEPQRRGNHLAFRPVRVIPGSAHRKSQQIGTSRCPGWRRVSCCGKDHPCHNVRSGRARWVFGFEFDGLVAEESLETTARLIVESAAAELSARYGSNRSYWGSVLRSRRLSA
jgi:hypothetical protein